MACLDVCYELDNDVCLDPVDSSRQVRDDVNQLLQLVLYPFNLLHFNSVQVDLEEQRL